MDGLERRFEWLIDELFRLSVGKSVERPDHFVSDERTFGERAADKLAAAVGSWRFICCQGTLILSWLAINGYLVSRHFQHRPLFNAWDPYPFILLNLCLSLQAAFTGPVLQLSGNRQARLDREVAEKTFDNTDLLHKLLTANTDLTRQIHSHLLGAEDPADARL